MIFLFKMIFSFLLTRVQKGERMRILGLDPGLRRTGWGVIEKEGARLRFVACGIVTSNAENGLAKRLAALFDGIRTVVREYAPDAAAVEETFVNVNPRSTLKLGQARGVALLAPALEGLDVAEYSPNMIKKTVVGSGHAGKKQIAMMIRILLGRAVEQPDAADALAAAVCHAHHFREGL